MAQGGGAGGTAAELAVGFGIAQQMMQQQGGVLGAQATPGVAGPPPAAAPAPELLAPADVAKILGVSEGDVLATITAGDLKAKKIGSTYRVTRAALDEFLKS
jgi:excisionase family DNA binding protein